MYEARTRTKNTNSQPSRRLYSLQSIYHSPPILYLKKSLLNLPPVALQIWLAEAIMNTPAGCKVSHIAQVSYSILRRIDRLKKYSPPNMTLTKFRSISLVYVVLCSSSWFCAGR